MTASSTTLVMLEKEPLHSSVEQPVPEDKEPTPVLTASNGFCWNVPRTESIITYIDETWYPVVYFLDNGEVLYSHE